MNKIFKLSGLLLVALVLVGVAIRSGNARLTGTDPLGANADVVCWGPTNAEVCQDYLGGILPTKARNAQALGTTALPWANLVVDSITVNNAATLSGALAVTGNVSAVGSITSSGRMILGKTAISGIYNSTTVVVTSPYETVASSGGDVTLISTPNISTSGVTSGTLLVLSSTSTVAVVFQDEGGLTGSRLQLGASTRSVSIYKTLTLIFDATDSYWREISYGSN